MRVKKNLGIYCCLMSAWLVWGCADTPAPAPAQPDTAKPVEAIVAGVDLDTAVKEAALEMEGKLPKGTKVALVNLGSPSGAFSEQVLLRLESALVRSGKVVVVDRANLDKIRAEQGFQLSGEVDDDSAKAIGKLLGAGAIVTGSTTDLGDVYSLALKAINIETATVTASYLADLTKTERIKTLMASVSAPASATPASGSSGGKPSASQTQSPASSAPASTASSGKPQSAQTQPPASSAPASGASSGKAPAPQTQAQAPTPPAPAPPPTNSPGLYVNGAFQGAMGLLDALDWITLNAQTGGVYVIVLGSDQGISNVVLDCGGKQVTVSLKTPGPERKVTFASRTPSYALFTVKAGVTFTLEDKVTLAGLQSGSRSLVNVEGGRFIMNGGTIKDNKVDGYELSGGGVFITSGGFTMNGGAISGNTVSNGYGGGVYVDAGTFTMNAGTISGNTARGNAYSGGGGVYVSYGTFTMSGGTISGNTTSSPVAGGGGGVYVSKGTFTMSGGAVSNNTAYGGGGVCVSGGGFTMSGGTISGNTARGSGAGGGVYVSGARFTMSGGTISGNTARGSGGGVCVNYNGTFTKSGSGGVIYGSDAAEEANRASKSGHAVYTSNGSRDTTARITRSLDSTKRGPEGGWE